MKSKPKPVTLVTLVTDAGAWIVRLTLRALPYIEAFKSALPR